MKIKRLSFSILFGLIFISVIFSFYYTFSLDGSYKFDSLVYTIEDNYIMGISSNTDINLFYQYFDIDNCSIEVLDKKGNKIKKGYVYNGSETILYDSSKNLIKRYKNIIYGDITEDGIVDNKDLESLGRTLVYKNKLEDYQIKSMDMNFDGKVKINDLVEIDKLLNQSYKSITLNYDEYTMLSGEVLRLVGTVSPNKILNQNLKWTSSNSDVVKVSEAGMVTSVKEGEAIITATSMDNKVSSSVKIIVDDTVRLKSNEGVGYVSGEKIRVGIRSVDYNNLECVSSNSSIASCAIENDMLVVQALSYGDVVITVNNGEYGSATYNFSSRLVNISISYSTYQCMPINSKTQRFFSSRDAGTLEFIVSDNEIIKKSYIEENVVTEQGEKTIFFVESGSKPGRATVSVKESNIGMQKVFTADVYDLRLPFNGDFFTAGEEKSYEILGGNFHDLSCVSPDDTKVTCRVDYDNNLLYIKGLVKGQYNIYLKNKINYNDKDYDCGEVSFYAVVLG